MATLSAIMYSAVLDGIVADHINKALCGIALLRATRQGRLDNIHASCVLDPSSVFPEWMLFYLVSCKCYVVQERSKSGALAQRIGTI